MKDSGIQELEYKSVPTRSCRAHSHTYSMKAGFRFCKFSLELDRLMILTLSTKYVI